MSAETTGTTATTTEGRVARLFGLSGDRWMRHANPWSVWTRFAVLPLLALAAWSRVWIGWWALLAAAVVVVFTVVNPLLFAPPRSTRHWASKAVFGERIVSEKGAEKGAIPEQFAGSRVPVVTSSLQVVALAALVVGLVRLDLLLAVTGVLFCQCAKAWYLDRTVLLFEDMKTRDPHYAAWEY
ncbi:DUF6653 family protein [Actinomycetospora aeridis]|uniref:DUF6653 family protein n=1 Tax=Actinomycetospora aeridis TaxID=3129231 RepID=A0ABU8N8Y7_9PSEU